MSSLHFPMPLDLLSKDVFVAAFSSMLLNHVKIKYLPTYLQIPYCRAARQIV